MYKKFLLIKIIKGTLMQIWKSPYVYIKNYIFIYSYKNNTLKISHS